MRFLAFLGRSSVTPEIRSCPPFRKSSAHYHYSHDPSVMMLAFQKTDHSAGHQSHGYEDNLPKWTDQRWIDHTAAKPTTPNCGQQRSRSQLDSHLRSSSSNVLSAQLCCTHSVVTTRGSLFVDLMAEEVSLCVMILEQGTRFSRCDGAPRLKIGEIE